MQNLSQQKRVAYFKICLCSQFPWQRDRKLNGIFSCLFVMFCQGLHLFLIRWSTGILRHNMEPVQIYQFLSKIYRFLSKLSRNMFKLKCHFWEFWNSIPPQNSIAFLEREHARIFAKLSSSSSPVELSTALILIISTLTHPHPPPPGIVVMRYF